MRVHVPRTIHFRYGTPSDYGTLASIFALSSLDDVCYSSANVVSDIGVQALVQALVGDYPARSDEDEKVGKEPRNQPLRRKIPILKTLDLGQVSEANVGIPIASSTTL